MKMKKPIFILLIDEIFILIKIVNNLKQKDTLFITLIIDFFTDLYFKLIVLT